MLDLFLDTASKEEIKTVLEWGILDGVTTNPTLIYREGIAKDDIMDYFEELTELVGKKPISLEVVGTEKEEIIEEARELHEVNENVIVKIPMIEEGLKAMKELNLTQRSLHDRGASSSQIRVNNTLCFSVNQAILASKANAFYVSPFLGRIDDRDGNGVQLVEEIRQVYDNMNSGTRILAASIRHPKHVKEVAKAGADIATMPFGVMKKMFDHPLTEKGLERFLNDWNSIE